MKLSPALWLFTITTILTTHARGGSPVEEHGLLRVQGAAIVDRNGDGISLAGNSFFWSQWDQSGFWNEDCLKWLVKDWGTSIVRIPMGIEDPGGYLEHPKENESKVRAMIDTSIRLGIYVIIDWHSHHAEDSTERAVDFFARIAKDYGHHDHVIYEIYNEPKDSQWPDIKNYAENVIAAIRESDPDNLIIVGSGEWSQRVDDPAESPITKWPNIAYTLHFYSKRHHQWLRDRAEAAMEKGIALFVTEWGPVGTVDGDPETEKWMAWCRAHKISHCAWAVNDKEEPWSIVRRGANPNGGWSIDDLTPAGRLEKAIISSWGEKNSNESDDANQIPL